MSERPKTHAMRARAAVVRVIGEAASDQERTAVARETYPTELVAAAHKLLRLVEGEARIRERHDEEFAATEIHEARAALALYEDKP